MSSQKEPQRGTHHRLTGKDILWVCVMCCTHPHKKYPYLLYPYLQRHRRQSLSEGHTISKQVRMFFGGVMCCRQLEERLRCPTSLEESQRGTHHW